MVFLQPNRQNTPPLAQASACAFSFKRPLAPFACQMFSFLALQVATYFG
jgi:hypothetical protein